MRQPLAILIGSMTSPTKRSATDSEAKKRLEIVRNDSLLLNKNNTTAFPATAAKADNVNHKDRTIEAVVLGCSSGQAASMFCGWQTVTVEV